MKISENSIIKKFFKEEIIDLDEEEVDKFLNKFNQQEVIQCLFDQLRTIALSNYPDESAWRLGRTFGDISKKYFADVKAYSWLNNFESLEKKVLLNFLSGYWDQTKPDFETLSDLSKVITKATSDKEWPQALVQVGIDAVTNGYSSLEYRSEVNSDVSNSFKEKLKIFETYLAPISTNSPDTYQTLKFVQSVLHE